MQLLSGKEAAEKIKSDLALRSTILKNKNLRIPHLVAILVGNNGASETYVTSKIKSCAETGFQSTLLRFEADTPESVLLDAIEKFNLDPSVDGILVTASSS